VILVDTSVWVEHLRTDDERLRTLLDGGEVLGQTRDRRLERIATECGLAATLSY
jgi:predicted nucleic acid-binding protein